MPLGAPKSNIPLGPLEELSLKILKNQAHLLMTLFDQPIRNQPTGAIRPDTKYPKIHTSQMIPSSTIQGDLNRAGLFGQLRDSRKTSVQERDLGQPERSQQKGLFP